MTTDNFTEAARAEAPEPCEHHWVSHGQDSALIPWVIRCDLCGAFDIAEMERAARAHLAAQEPTDAELLAALNAQGVVASPKMHPAPSLDYWGDKPAEAMRAALSAARRDEETR